MDAKREFVALATASGRRNMRELCRRFGISPTTAYELVRRFAEEGGEQGLEPRSRRPRSSPTRTAVEVERVILAMRDDTHWGARKIEARLRKLGLPDVPPRTTINNVLKRHGRIHSEESLKHVAWHRFEHPEPNDLWQMDFKGWFLIGVQRCNPLTILDDHSRFSLCLRACFDQTTKTVQNALTDVFSRYGLPWRVTVDRGSPWGDDPEGHLTRLEVWMLRLGIQVSHSRPYHPQTQGKDERFHRTLDDELLRYAVMRDMTDAQRQFDRFRRRYNFERPHEALSMSTPSERYRPSTRSFPAVLPPVEYAESAIVRQVDRFGKISFRGRIYRVGKGCATLPVALRPTSLDGVFHVFFCHHLITEIDIR